MTKPAVLLTGANGFIAQHILDKLLTRKYKVIGTVRSDAKASQLLKAFKGKYPDADLTVEVVSDMVADDAFDAILKNNPDITYVLHTASPNSFGVSLPLEDAYLKPAVNGTLNILKGVQKYAPQVKNVVITSSIVAILQRGPEYLTTVLTNKLWNPITWEEVDNDMDAYTASKKYAEQAARKFYEEEKPKFKMATVNPPLVLGPQVFDEFVTKELNSSNAMMNIVAHLPPSDEPQTAMPLGSVDVRDVAEFHILPLENEKLAEERIAVAEGPLIAQRVLNILNDNFPELRGKICKGDYSSARELEDTACPKFDFSSTMDKVGHYDFIPLETSIVDLFKQYLSKFPFG